MQKPFIFILLICGTLYCSCSRQAETASNTPSAIKATKDTLHIHLKLEDNERNEGKDNYGNILRVPFSTFTLETTSKPAHKNKIGTFDGMAMQVISLSENGFPDSTILAYRCFFSGKGTDIAVVKHPNEVLVVIRKLSDFTRHKENFKIVDRLSIKKDQPLTIR